LVISKDASLKFWSYEISCKSFISCVEFFTLKQYGRGIYVCSFLTSVFAVLYAGAFFQLTIGLMGASVLCILISPLMLGAVGFRFTNFHRSSLAIMSWHSFIVVLISRCSLLVISLLVFWNLLLVMNVLTFLLYSVMYIIIMEYLTKGVFDETDILLFVFEYFSKICQSSRFVNVRQE
jgi:hypothetical protein